jgi:hypothetical protein
MPQFKRGESGNPAGRPKVLSEVREAARKHTLAAIDTLLAILRDEQEDARARVAAVNAILDRGWGKPAQSLEVDTRHQWSGEEIVLVTSAYAPAPPPQEI